jgi:hypothetical protein
VVGSFVGWRRISSFFLEIQRLKALGNNLISCTLSQQINFPSIKNNCIFKKVPKKNLIGLVPLAK